LKPLRLAAAAALLAALLGGYYLFDQVYLAGKETQRRQESLLLALDPEKVERIRISRPGLDVVEVAREKGVWRISAPIQTEADQQVIGAMISAAAQLTAEKDLGQPADLAEYGLGSPVVVEFIPADGRNAATLSIGAKNPLSGHVYVLSSHKPGVSLISGMSAGDLDHSLFDVREKKLFRSKMSDLLAFEYSSDGMEKIRVDKKENGQWEITRPMQAPASAVAAEGLAQKFLSVSASGFYEEASVDLSIYGLDRPAVEFTAYFAGQEQGVKMALGSGAGEGGVYALWPGGARVVRVAQDILKGLPRSIMDIRLKRLVSFDAASVTGVSIISDDYTLEMRKKESKKGEPQLWDITTPIQTAADPVAVSGLLNQIGSIEALDFAKDSQEKARAMEALKKPELTITLATAQGPVNIRFAKASDPQRYWAGADGNLESLQVSQSVVAPLSKTVFDLRERRLFHMASADVEKVAIHRLGQAFEVEKHGDEYMVTKPEKIKLKAGQWTEFLWSIFELRFAGVISEERQEPGDPSFGEPVMTITIFGEGGRTLEKVEIAKAVDDDKWYKARLANTPGLYDVDWFYVEDDVTLALEKILGINKKEEEAPNLFR